MLFTQPIFLGFFVVVFAVAWLVRHNTGRKLWLLAASYVFYAGWDWRFLSLIAISTLVDYLAGLAVERTEEAGRRRAWLILSLAANLGILGFFKYYNFFIDSAAALLRPLGLEAGDRALEIVLPVGISFFTFQSLSYTFDIYRRRLKPIRSFLDFALFVAFFPQLVAGPIVRAAHFLPQLARLPQRSAVDVRGCLTLFLLGFIKKSCIADNVSPIVDPVFADPGAHTALAVWIAVLFYAVQIYCDFSGYTDMAIATAGLLGYELGPNFNFPYLASSLTEFWRRWHISLSSWLRDYLYIPLGGNRGSRLFTYRNLMLTMLLGGLWHGAAWTFVVWGGLHGAVLVVHREWKRRVQLPSWGVAGRLIGTVATFYFVCFAWIFFRAQSFGDAATLVKGYLLLQDNGPKTLDPALLAAFGALAIVHALYRRGWPQRLVSGLPGWAFATGYGAAAALALSFVPLRAAPFIYFQF